MKYIPLFFAAILVVILIALSSVIYADQIKCYSNGKKILDTVGKDIAYDENVDVISFIEFNTQDSIYVFKPDCVIKEPK